MSFKFDAWPSLAQRGHPAAYVSTGQAASQRRQIIPLGTVVAAMSGALDIDKSIAIACHLVKSQFFSLLFTSDIGSA
ncbi:hypothetical protein [Bosea sp. (in: a-proteobacteria)]|uniref:hypothetical protein n=1 Tax=Bosea sp. (in: a-proteobacteria) TaxID=1871050 RepID=UPI0027350E78|nr:hypothetical protein [Bosea sp. (in: a-proteobacteria)]MDP3254552.1 hypothetical protein [Bosea sp. (in: a-proteobacteria)]